MNAMERFMLTMEIEENRTQSIEKITEAIVSMIELLEALKAKEIDYVEMEVRLSAGSVDIKAMEEALQKEKELESNKMTFEDFLKKHKEVTKEMQEEEIKAPGQQSFEDLKTEESPEYQENLEDELKKREAFEQANGMNKSKWTGKKPKGKKLRDAENKKRKRLNFAEVDDIKVRYGKGVSISKIAKQYGIADVVVHRILLGEIYNKYKKPGESK